MFLSSLHTKRSLIQVSFNFLVGITRVQRHFQSCHKDCDYSCLWRDGENTTARAAGGRRLQTVPFTIYLKGILKISAQPSFEILPSSRRFYKYCKRNIKNWCYRGSFFRDQVISIVLLDATLINTLTFPKVKTLIRLSLAVLHHCCLCGVVTRPKG